MKSLGLCVGASTLSAVAVQRAPDGAIAPTLLQRRTHDGNPRQALVELVASIDPGRYDRIAVTGRKFRHLIQLTAIAEPQAVETALSHVHQGGPALDAVVSAGGESFIAYGFGRAYNAWAPEANKGIPRKFASRGLAVAPLSALPLDAEAVADSMYWSSGRMILKGAAFVARHPQLFACFITNFSCGPDSFLLGYVRQAMGDKPFLVLELDAHVADAGLETRIEAFLDIIRHHRTAPVPVPAPTPVPTPAPATAAIAARMDHRALRIRDSRGRPYPLTYPRVHLILPSMGHFHADAAAAVFRSAGVRATALPDADAEALRLGRAVSSGKECLPLQLTVGSLLKYLQGRTTGDEVLVYFMPATGGPCRFGQYSRFMADLIARLGQGDLALWSPSSDNSYADLNAGHFTLKLWTALSIADRMTDLEGVLRATARDRGAALALYDEECRTLLGALASDPTLRALRPTLARTAARLRSVPLRRPPGEVQTILLTGEIFVRHDALSRQGLVERLADQGFAVRVAGLTEWIHYTDLCVRHGWNGRSPTLTEQAALFLRATWKRRYERIVAETLAASGLIPPRVRPVADLVERARPLISPRLQGKSVLTVGGALAEVPEPYCGVIAIGPFGCMPNRVAEALLTPAMHRGEHCAVDPVGGRPAATPAWDATPLPFLAIESDGTPVPQLVEARLEVFLMQAARVQARRGRPPQKLPQ